MKKLNYMFIAINICGMALFGCKQEDKTPALDVTLKETTLGKVFTDGAGKTLYFFSPDVKGASTCTGGCLTNWPVFYKDLTNLDPTISATDFGTITREDGAKQTTFKGWPMYYFSGDIKAGDTNGENVGTKWFVAKPTYTLMLANAQLIGNDGKKYTSKYVEGEGDTQYFVDQTGRTIYGFANDKKNTNKYTKADFSNDATWPIYGPELKDLPSTMDKSLFSTIQVFGKNQLTYKGWPLYYFGPDNKERGINKGISVPRPGVWPVVNKDTPEAPAP
jgi:predicted lipoprotein with Yx(FWY)xxD motif